MKDNAATNRLSDDELLAELGVSAEPPKTGGRTPREERIIAGFEDIQRFFETHGRVPQHGEELDIFERLYAVRLDRLRAMPEALTLLAGRDTHGLLAVPDGQQQPKLDELNDEALLAELGVGGGKGEADITVLRHVRPRDERQAAEEIANRAACRDFERFKPLFEQAESDLQGGLGASRAVSERIRALKRAISSSLAGSLSMWLKSARRSRLPMAKAMRGCA
jgi:hypothetical protein